MGGLLGGYICAKSRRMDGAQVQQWDLMHNWVSGYYYGFGLAAYHL